jgi:hypothetical protein
MQLGFEIVLITAHRPQLYIYIYIYTLLIFALTEAFADSPNGLNRDIQEHPLPNKFSAPIYWHQPLL